MGKNSKKNLINLITDFIEYCEVEKNLSPTTAEKYHYRLQRFAGWLAKRKKVEFEKLILKDVSEENIRSYRLYLNRYLNAKTRLPLKKSTQINSLVTLRAFLRYLKRIGVEKAVSAERVELGKSEARSLKFLDLAQMNKLMSQPNTSKPMGLRDRALMELLFSTGLRVSELTGLNREDVNLVAREFNVLGKGRRRRVVFLSDSAIAWLTKYLEFRESDDFEPLFIAAKKITRSDASKTHGKQLSDTQGRLSVRQVQRIIKKYARKAGLSVDATPHVLRHSFATDLLMAGADLRSVQELLGHKNISTTQIYTHITDPQLKKIHQKFHGKST